MADNQNPNEVSPRFAAVCIGLAIGVPVGFVVLDNVLPAPWPLIIFVTLCIGAPIYFVTSNKKELTEMADKLRDHQREQEKKPFVGRLHWLLNRRYILFRIVLIACILYAIHSEYFKVI